MTAQNLLPRDVPITPAYQDPNDSQRLWALGWSEHDGYVWLTAFHGNMEWVVSHALPDDDERGRFGLTAARVTLWHLMLTAAVSDSNTPRPRE